MAAHPVTTTPPRIAVIGSCATTQALKLLGLSHRHLAFSVARQSLACLTSESPGLSYPDLAALDIPSLVPSVHHWLKTDLSKSVPSMLEQRGGDILILDLLDERFDLLMLTSGLVVNASWDLLNSGVAETPIFAGARRIPRLSQEAWDLWEAGLVRWRQWFIQSPIKQCKILLHHAFWASVQQTSPNTLVVLPDTTTIMPPPEEPVSRSAHQALLERYYKRFVAEFPETVVIGAPQARIADPAHHWGPAPYHFIPQYYSTIAELLRQHGVPACPPNTEPPEIR